MSPSAQRAQFDFVRLAAEEPSSLYFEQFLREGYEAWPSSYQARFTGLATWHGVAGFKQSLRTLAGSPRHWNVLLASRSLSLVKLAARAMFRTCCHVLTTDLGWLSYQRTIEHWAQRTGRRVTSVPLRDHLLYRQWTTRDVADWLAQAYAAAGCDGLFLPVVDHLGVRLPIREIVAAIERQRRIKFCLLDAAQAFCHVPINDCFCCADFLIAGSHKWMGAYLPLGIGFVPRLRSRLGRPPTIDPLLHLAEQLDTGALDHHSETANLSPLFACAGAAEDRLSDQRSESQLVDVPVTFDRLPTSLQEWQVVAPAPPLQSRIVLLESANPQTRRLSADEVRRRWLQEGLVITGYDGGRVRLASPASSRKDESLFPSGSALLSGR